MSIKKVEFIEQIRGKLPTANPSELNEFAEFHINLGAPQDFLDKVSQGFTYIDELNFMANLDLMAKKAKQVIGNRRYHTVMFKSRGSGRWVYEQLLRRGLKSAIGIYSLNDPVQEVEPVELLESRIKQEDIVISVDDWIIGGHQMMFVAGTMPEEARSHIFVLLADGGGIDDATSGNMRVNIHTTMQSPPRLRFELFNREEEKYMDYLYDITAGPEELFNPMSMLLHSYISTPDNVPDVFIGNRTLKSTGLSVPKLFTPKVPIYRQFDYQDSLHINNPEYR